MKKLYSFLLALAVVFTAAAQATIDFTQPKAFNPALPYVNGPYSRPYVAADKTYQSGPFTLQFSNRGTQILGSSGPATFANGATLEITAPEGLVITKIVANRPQGYYYAYNKFNIDGDEGENVAASQTFTFEKPVSNVTLTSMMSNGRIQNLQVWIEPKGEDPDPEPVTPDALYMLGTLEGNSWSNGVAGVKDGDMFIFDHVDLAAAEGSSDAEFTFTGAETFSTVTEHPSYAPAADKTPISAGQSANLVINETTTGTPNCFTIAADHYYKFIVDFSGETPIVTVIEDGEKPKPVAVPEALYLLGTVEGNNWSEGVAGTKDGNVFTFENIDLVAPQGGEAAEFTFTAAESIFLVSDAYSYGPAANETAIAAGESAELTVFEPFTYFERPNYYTISPDHYYTFVVEFGQGAPVVKVLDAGEKPVPATRPEALYLYTIGLDGVISSPLAATKLENETFVFENADLTGVEGIAKLFFSAADKASSIATSQAFGPSNDETSLDSDNSAQEMKVFEAGEFGARPFCYTITDNRFYTFSVNFTDAAKPMLTVAAGEEKPAPAFEPLYLQGTFLNRTWKLNQPYEPTSIEAKGDYTVYTFESVPMVAAAGEEYARFFFSSVKAESESETPDWAAVNAGEVWGSDFDDEVASEVADGEFEVYLCYHAPGTLGSAMPNSYNVDNRILYTYKMYRHNKYPGRSYYTLKNVGVVIDTFVESIEAEQLGEARYFNLQGVSVDAPAAGAVYIRVQGGKATKVRL